MSNLEIYCTSIQYFNILDKLPSYIKPLGLGNNNYPDHWLKEKNGKNISNLNKYYGETSGFYWVWKNRLNNKDKNLLIPAIFFFISYGAKVTNLYFLPGIIFYMYLNNDKKNYN